MQEYDLKYEESLSFSERLGNSFIKGRNKWWGIVNDYITKNNNKCVLDDIFVDLNKINLNSVSESVIGVAKLNINIKKEDTSEILTYKKLIGDINFNKNINEFKKLKNILENQKSFDIRLLTLSREIDHGYDEDNPENIVDLLYNYLNLVVSYIQTIPKNYQIYKTWREFLFDKIVFHNF